MYQKTEFVKYNLSLIFLLYLFLSCKEESKKTSIPIIDHFNINKDQPVFLWVSKKVLALLYV